MKDLSGMWPEFLEWVNDYVGCGEDGAANAQYSREDMRYAFQAGYEKQLAESVPKSEIEKLKYKISIEEGWSVFLIIGELQKLLTSHKE